MLRRRDIFNNYKVCYKTCINLISKAFEKELSKNNLFACSKALFLKNPQNLQTRNDNKNGAKEKRSRQNTLKLSM